MQKINIRWKEGGVVCQLKGANKWIMDKCQKRKGRRFNSSKIHTEIWEQQNDIVRITDGQKREASSSVWGWRAGIDPSRFGKCFIQMCLEDASSTSRRMLTRCNFNVTLSFGSSLKTMSHTEDSAFWLPWNTFHTRMTEIILSFIWRLLEWEVGACSRHCEVLS